MSKDIESIERDEVADKSSEIVESSRMLSQITRKMLKSPNNNVEEELKENSSCLTEEVWSSNTDRGASRGR